MSARVPTSIAWASGRAVRPMSSSNIFARPGYGIRSASRAGRMAASVRSIIARAISPSCHTVTPTCSKRSTSTTRHADFLKRAEPDKTELTRSIIGTIGDIDAYQLPDAKGYTSMQRYLAGETDDIRQRRRDEILGASVADFRAFADALAESDRPWASGRARLRASDSSS